jgi:L-cystine uptake protein TcyP (sodium:dicarboxylate symporter family)
LIAVTGLHTNPVVSGMLFLVVAVIANVGVIWWVLKQTASDSGYGRQLLNGLLVGVIAGVLIFCFSLLFTQVLFPDYMAESQDATIAWMESTGMPEAQLDAQVAKLEAQTGWSQAIGGTVGTIVTSLIVAAIVGIFARKK